jgi:hypothetical protein
MDSSAWMNDITIENPHVSIGDEWGDFRGWNGRDSTGAGVLPPIKRKFRQDEESGKSRQGGGLTVEIQIDPKLRKQRTDVDSGGGLEVVYFNQEVIKLEVDDDAPAKVERIETFRPLPILSRSQIMERQLDREVAQDWGKAKGLPAKWMFGAAIGVVGTVILAMVLLPFVQPSEVERHHVVYTAVNEAPLAEDSLGQIEMLRRADEATGLFRRFAGAVTSDDLLATVRKQEEVLPLIKRTPLRPMVPARWKPPQECEWESYSEQGRICGILRGVLPDFSPFTAFMTMEHGVLLVDWKATTGYGTAEFTELEQGHGNASEIRGFLKPGEFYTAAFPEQEFRSYVLLSADREHSVWAYTRRDGVQEVKLSASFAGGEIVAPDAEAQRFTVALARPDRENAAPNQWIIKEVLHKQWIRP